MNYAEIVGFGLQAGTDRTIYAEWTWSKSGDNTDYYKVKWWYDTGDGVWFVGSESNTTERHATYNAPANAVRVSFQVKPVSKTYEVNDKTVYYWHADWSTTKEYYFKNNPPEIPPTPTVTIDEYQLTAKVENLDVNAYDIEFEIVQNDSTIYKTILATIRTNSSSVSCVIDIGSKYKVRCRAKRYSLYSEWSGYSANVLTKPNPPGSLDKCETTSKTSVMLTWTASSTAKTYDVEYSTNRAYLGTSNSSTIINNIDSTVYTVTGLNSGETYYFRVRAVNDVGSSSWTSIKSATVGTKPEPPISWSSTTTAIVNENVILYWVHNSEDNSKEKEAEIEFNVNNSISTVIVEAPSEEDDTNRSYVLDTSKYDDSTVINWRVRTKGAIDEWGDWSITRSINIYAPPVVTVTTTNKLYKSASNILRTFPLGIKAVYGPKTQTPIGYHLYITAEDNYETIDEVGNSVYVSAGDELFSKFYNVNEDLSVSLTPSDIILSNNMHYGVHCIVTMNTGLTAEDVVYFKVAWEETVQAPNAEILYDDKSLSMRIRPYCSEYYKIYYEVEYDPSTGKCYRTDVIMDETKGLLIEDVYTEVYGDQVYQGNVCSRKNGYFCIVQSESPSLIDNVTLSVYRREYDGRFVEIAKNLNNFDNSFVSDPHPSLDYGRYRIVATHTQTGSMSFTDIPAVYIGEKAIVIQWDDKWNSFDISSDGVVEQTSWSGSMLKLPYNIDISDNNSLDVELVKYIGRSHPVSYYGTQLGYSSTWNVEIPKYDKNTLYSLRRLSSYTGDVYVREPSGSGYWANISVSFVQTHCELTIPVTFNIVRVEGGI